MIGRLSRILSRYSRRAPQWARFLILGATAGILGGLAAAGFEWGLHLGSGFLVGRFTHLGAGAIYRFHWGVLLLPALGGLVSGILIHLVCRRATGHGTDLLVHAFHHEQGRLPLRAPLAKAAAAVWLISCGGSAGPEGPIAALGAAIGSTLGRLFGVTLRERRILLLAGCGAGIGAIFQCPLGGALFATSILYREPEFEAEAIVPSVVASVLGYSTFMIFWGLGENLLHGAATLTFSTPIELVPYALLGLLCGGAGILFSLCMRMVEERWLPLSRLPRWFAPALGGLATGALACLLPQVMDGQYRFVQNAMDGQLFANEASINWWRWAGIFGCIGVAKCVATALTVGSGGSGGVLGPSVFIGGAAGAFLGALCEAAYPGTFPEQLREALIPVGMGGVLAATMRTPLAAIVMVTEMTGSYGLIVPSMLVCIGAYVTGRRWGLNHAQVRGAAESPAHAGDLLVHMLRAWRVADLIERDSAIRVAPDTPLAELITRIPLGTWPVFTVVEHDRILGLISGADIQRIMNEPALAHAVIAADLMRRPGALLYPDESVYQVLNEFQHESDGVLPVVERGARARLLGTLTREGVFKAVRRRIRKMQESIMREHRGLAAFEKEGQLHELLAGFVPRRGHTVQRLLVPLQAVGRSLREADFRRNFGTEVIAIEAADGSIHCPPDIDAPLRTDQRLVALVPERDPTDTGGGPPADERPFAP